MYTYTYIWRNVCHNSNYVNVGGVREHIYFSLGIFNVSCVTCEPYFYAFVSRETGTKNDFQRKFLFSDQFFSDYSATKGTLYFT